MKTLRTGPPRQPSAERMALCADLIPGTDVPGYFLSPLPGFLRFRLFVNLLSQARKDVEVRK